MNDFFNTEEGRRMVKFGLGALVLLGVFLALESASLIKGIATPDIAVNTISVSGTGESTSIPDIATFTFSVSADAHDVATAQQTVTSKTNTTLQGLKDMGIDDKDLKTTDYSVYPKYTYTNPVCSSNICPPSRQIPDGYTVSQSVLVKVRKTDDAGKALALAGDKGATNISGLTLTLDDPNAPLNDARIKAIADARSKAEALAKGLGVRLVRVTGFSDNSQPSPIPMYATYDKAVMGLGASAPTIPTGENKTTSTVTVTYEIR